MSGIASPNAIADGKHNVAWQGAVLGEGGWLTSASFTGADNAGRAGRAWLVMSVNTSASPASKALQPLPCRFRRRRRQHLQMRLHPGQAPDGQPPPAAPGEYPVIDIVQGEVA